MSAKKKVLVGMSGGVDSSVAAALLLDAGYDVTGAFMINFDEHDEHGLPCYTHEYRDALRVAAKLGIKLLKLDFVEVYKKHVLEYMYAEYEAGRTPNPDVLCNKFIKFDAWLTKSKELGFDMFATGHYARTTDGVLYKAKDNNKDQTYFLHQVSSEQLSNVLFPLGEYTKEEVRALAKKFDLPTAHKEESMGICFVGEVSMKEFLQKRIEQKPGNIVMSGTGEVIGQHEGLAFYTLGQRHGFHQVGGDDPLFVAQKRSETNELVVGHEGDPLLYSDSIQVTNMHWISGQAPAFPLECEVRLRHRQPLQAATCNKDMIIFEQKQKAATPGQFAAIYRGDICLGGGIIA